MAAPAMNNFRSLSTATTELNAGFQFEFSCQVCGDTWRSPFKPYRKGQLTGLLTQASYLTGELGGWLNGISRTVTNIYRASRGVNAFAGAGASGALAQAQADAIALAQERYHCCESCRRWVGEECFDSRSGTCVDCAKEGSPRASTASGAAGSLACPNCQTASQGGRFCHECGFDMASTHKSCPGCGATLPREARFCVDCGHGF